MWKFTGYSSTSAKWIFASFRFHKKKPLLPSTKLITTDIWLEKAKLIKMGAKGIVWVTYINAHYS